VVTLHADTNRKILTLLGVKCTTEMKQAK